MGPTYWCHDLDLSGSRNVSCYVTFDSPGATSYRCSIVTESLSPTIFDIMGILYIWVTTMTVLGHGTSSVTWPIDPPHVISYWCPIGTVFLPSIVFEIFASKYI